MVPLGADGRTAAWVRLTVREDYAMKRWDLYADGRMIAGDLIFTTHAVTRPVRIAFAGPAGGAASAFDDVLVGFENPLFADADKDGLDDAWEAANGLNPAVNDRDSDADGDGVTAAAEYRKGTDPRDFFDAVAPRVDALNGGVPGPYDDLALLVRRPDGSPWPNAPAVFAITSGGRKIGPTSTGPFSTSVEVRADSDGVATAFLEPLP
jgi:hypothetical protein